MAGTYGECTCNFFRNPPNWFCNGVCFKASLYLFVAPCGDVANQ